MIIVMANHSIARTKFAKRHYEAIALAMQEASCMANNGEACKKHGVAAAIEELFRVFARDNSQFKRERFIAACVPGANVRARSNGGSR
jgi:hypothetical protein